MVITRSILFIVTRFLWQYCRDEPSINSADGEIVDFSITNTITDSFKFKQEITGETGNGGRKSVDLKVSLKKVSNF